MSADTIVDRLYREYKELFHYLERDNQMSYMATLEESFRKSILLASASYFEHKICDCISEFAKEKSKNKMIMELIRNKAIERQYFTYFNWEETNANRFFSLFGCDFKDYMKKEIEKDQKFKEAITAFLTIGQERNLLVHNNYAAYGIEKTGEEIYDLYKCAYLFIELLPDKFRDASKICK